jgi:hypothetical protein
MTKWRVALHLGSGGGGSKEPTKGRLKVKAVQKMGDPSAVAKAARISYAG